MKLHLCLQWILGTPCLQRVINSSFRALFQMINGNNFLQLKKHFLNQTQPHGLIRKCIHETSSEPSMDIRNTMSSNSHQFKLPSIISDDHWQQFSFTEETFLESNSASWIDPQCTKKHVNIPVKSVASTVKLQCEKPNIKGSSMHAPGNYVIRKTKSLSFNSGPYHLIQTRESSFAYYVCKVCGNMTVSHSQTYLAGSCYHGSLEVPTLHSLDENTSVWSPERASTKLVKKNHHIWSSRGWDQNFLDKGLHNSKSIHSRDQDDSCKSECRDNSAISPTHVQQNVLLMTSLQVKDMEAVT